MKIRLILLSVALLVVAIAVARSLYKPSSQTLEISVTKTDQRILRAQQSVAKFPKSALAYNQLASAYMQKARESGNFAFNANANDAIDHSLAVEPENYDGLKLRTKLQLTYHRFAEALETARHIQTIRDDDHDVLGTDHRCAC